LMLLVACLLVPLLGRAAPLPAGTPEEAGMRPELASDIDRLVQEALEAKKMPGCVVTVGRHGRIVYQKAHGYRQVEPEREEMTLDTLFDLASLTKPIATSTSVMQLVEQGKVRLADPVSQYLPEFTS